MGDADLWLIVEGRDHDRTYYDRLVRELPETHALQVSLRLAEQITLDGSSAGGKSHAIKLHDRFAELGLLVQKSSQGPRTIAFMLDRDRDDFAGTSSDSRHVLYTISADVEGDILLHADIWRAIESAYGLASASSRHLADLIGDPSDALLQLWADWIKLGLLALACGSAECPKYSRCSLVNDQVWGAVDAEKVASLRASIASAGTDETLDLAHAKAEAYFAREGKRLLKGRWIAQYVHEVIRVHLADETVRANVAASVVIATALETLNHRDAWARHYGNQFSALLSM